MRSYWCEGRGRSHTAAGCAVMSLAQPTRAQLPRPATAARRPEMCCKGGLVKFGWQGPPELHGHRTVLETAVLLLHQAPKGKLKDESRE
jgi:hypothetical protein